jgi:hypothetical protein
LGSILCRGRNLFSYNNCDQTAPGPYPASYQIAKCFEG